MHTPENDAAAESLRAAMVDQLRISDERVVAALRAVPRHVFVPNVSLETAYANNVVRTKYVDGEVVSSASQPSMVGLMLEQADIRPGHRILEIGAGTGYNAALLAHLVGPSGRVTTVDIDEDIVDDARRGLTAAGYGQVRAELADGELGFPDDAPYDRIIVTVGAGDLPPAWWNQLAEDGRLVVPLRIWGGAMRSIAFDRVGDHWQSCSLFLCGFVPMRGLGAFTRRSIPLADAGNVTLSVYDEQVVDDLALAGILASPAHEVWTGVTFALQESFEWMYLWLMCTAGEFCQLSAEGQNTGSQNTGRRLADSLFTWGSMAMVNGNQLGYLIRRISGRDDAGKPTGYEIGIRAHGPGGAGWANHIADQLRLWDRVYRSGPGPIVQVYPAGSTWPEGQFVFDKRHSRTIVSWVS